MNTEEKIKDLRNKTREILREWWKLSADNSALTPEYRERGRIPQTVIMDFMRGMFPLNNGIPAEGDLKRSRFLKENADLLSVIMRSAANDLAKSLATLEEATTHLPEDVAETLRDAIIRYRNLADDIRDSENW